MPKQKGQHSRKTRKIKKRATSTHNKKNKKRRSIKCKRKTRKLVGGNKFGVDGIIQYMNKIGQPNLQLCGVSILHRHGARGPGDSELKLWITEEEENGKKTKKIEPVTKWQNDELENITGVGKEMITNLGKWFQKKYNLDNNSDINWYSSKSDRAKESGVDFMKGLLGKFDDPPIYGRGDEDLYFRPWNVKNKDGKKEGDIISTAAKKQGTAIEKANGNAEFLKNLFTILGRIESFKTTDGEYDLVKMLWSTTHIQGLYECERFWPNGEVDGNRDYITNILTENEIDMNTLRELAYWVLTQRFFTHNKLVGMGGKITSDILSKTTDNKINVFSGHDYTIMSVLANLAEQTKELPQELTKGVEFGSYLIFEKWCNDKTPERNIMRIYYNDEPFVPKGIETVNNDTHQLLIELPINVVTTIISNINQRLDSLQL